jgi:hypothetical protein
VQQQALTDPALLAEQETLQSHVDAAMLAAEPKLKEKQARLQELQQKMMVAQQANDQETLQAVGQEGNALQMELQGLQAKAVEDETIAAEVEAFRASVQAKMATIDPEVPKLVERVNEIAMIMQGGGPGGPAPGGAPATGEAPAAGGTPSGG